MPVLLQLQHRPFISWSISGADRRESEHTPDEPALILADGALSFFLAWLRCSSKHSASLSSLNNVERWGVAFYPSKWTFALKSPFLQFLA